MALRVVPAVAVLAFVLSGCASPGADQEPVAPAGPTLSASPTESPSLPVLATGTDTMHLQDAPHMTARAPTGQVDTVVALPGFSDAFGNAFLQANPNPGITWRLPRQGLAVLEGNATLWVDVHGTVTNPSPTNGCFWSIMLKVEGADGSQVGQGSQCLREDNVVAEGVRSLQVTFAALDASTVQGDTLALTVFSNGVYAPGAGIDLLTGSVEHDSRLAVHGLALPLDTQTYL